ncbi:MAG: dTDP-4-dehydrorhamnose reductase [Alphaproteobacteria bacterium]
MILVFGRTGQVATELQRQASVTALGRDTADLSDPEACSAAIEAHAPAVVINAAAWTAVDAAEAQESDAMRINAKAPGAMAQACCALEIPFLHISTDYVFEGSGTRAWRETDPVAPKSAYGRTKLAGEHQVAEAGGHWAILRTSWIFSAHGGNFVKTMLRLSESRDSLSIVADQVGCPTPAADIAATLLRMGREMTKGQGGGLYHYGGQPPVSWADFARAIFANAGKTVTVEDIPTSAYPTPAERPRNSRLDCAKLTRDFGIEPPDWTTGLVNVLKELDRV